MNENLKTRQTGICQQIFCKRTGEKHIQINSELIIQSNPDKFQTLRLV